MHCYWCGLPPADCGCKARTRHQCPLCQARLLRFTDTGNAACLDCGLSEEELRVRVQGTAFIAGYHTGYRCWRTDVHRTMLRETDPSNPLNWALLPLNTGRGGYLPYQRMEAYCDLGGRVAPCDQVHSEGGWGCGIYAVKRASQLGLYQRDCIVGQVALWGAVVEHEEGWRAQYAYPLAFLHVWFGRASDLSQETQRHNLLPADYDPEHDRYQVVEGYAYAWGVPVVPYRFSAHS